MIRKIIHIDEEKCNGCGGLQRAAGNALQASGKSIPLRVVTVAVYPGLSVWSRQRRIRRQEPRNTILIKVITEFRNHFDYIIPRNHIFELSDIMDT